MEPWELIDQIEEALESDDATLARDKIARLIAEWRKTASDEDQGH